MCLAYAESGCKAITVVDINVDGIQETIKLIEAQHKNVKTLAVEANTTDLVAVKRMVSETIEAFGSLDYGNEYTPTRETRPCIY